MCPPPAARYLKNVPLIPISPLISSIFCPAQIPLISARETKQFEYPPQNFYKSFFYTIGSTARNRRASKSCFENWSFGCLFFMIVFLLRVIDRQPKRAKGCETQKLPYFFPNNCSQSDQKHRL